MKVDKGRMMEFLSRGKTTFKMPIYQRPYSWTTEECQNLLCDLIRIVDTPKEHFVGPVVYIGGSFQMFGNTTCQIIDGQQRLTTIFLLTLAIYRYLNEQGDEDSIDLANSLKQYLFIEGKELTTFSSMEDLKIQLTDFDNEQLLTLCKNPFEVPNEKHLIFDNFNFFYKEIKEDIVDAESLIHALGNLIIVDLSLEKGQDDPQVMFESLNATGKGLTPSDLIQNFLLMGLNEELQKNIYHHYWLPLSKEILKYDSDLSTFITNYVILKDKKPIGNKNRLFQDFKNFFADHYTKESESMLTFAKEIFHYSKMYTYLFNEEHPIAEIRTKLKDLNTLKITTHIPLTMEILSYFEQGFIKTEDVVKSLGLIETFIIRRFICEKPTNELPHVFRKLLSTLNKDQFLHHFEYTLMTRKDNQALPRDMEFVTALIKKGIYQDSKYCRFLLTKLTEKNSREGIPATFTIEHILPQTQNLPQHWIDELGENYQEIHATYVHTIGNLTLTCYNSELGTKSFQEKKTMPNGFNDSRCWLNKTLESVEHWNEQAILDRAHLIAEHCLSIWSIPEEFQTDEEYEKLLTFDEEWKNKKIVGFKIFNESHPISDFTELILKLTEILYEKEGRSETLFFDINQRFIGRKKVFSKEQLHSGQRLIQNSSYYMTIPHRPKEKKSLILTLLDVHQLGELDLEIYKKQ